MNIYKGLLRTIWQKIKFEQKKEWDKIAISFLEECDFIVDVGCGEGRFISQDPFKILGIECNNKSLKKCKEQGYNVIKSDIRALPFQGK